MSSLTMLTRLSLLLWLPVYVHGATFNMTAEEGQSGLFSCPYRNAAWNVTFNDDSKFTVCKNSLCYNMISSGVWYSGRFTEEGSYLNISQIQRNMTKILCISFDPYRISHTWLLSVVVRPTVPVCNTPVLSPISKNNYMISLTCKTTVHPEANCSVVAKGSFETWQSRIVYDDQKSLRTGLFTTQCTVSLFIYADTSVGPIQYMATVYPDVLRGQYYNVSNEWRTWLPGEPVNVQVVSFMANMQTVSLEAAVGTDVTFTCKGVGPPGTTLTLYNSSSNNRVMKSGDIDEDLIYEITNIQCVATSTIKCVAGDDTTTAKEIIFGVLNCPGPSTECCDNNMILALVITLTTATVVTLIIILCCIRLRRRLYKSQARAQHRQEGESIHINALQPPPYDEVFHINVAAMGSRHDLMLPDYDSLPPPYADVVRVDRALEPSAPLEPGIQESSPTRGSHTPAAYPTFML